MFCSSCQVWSIAHGCPWSMDACTKTAKNGHLEVLQWAHTNGCPWYDSICPYAAWMGHIDILQWVHTNGFPYGINIPVSSLQQLMVIWSYCSGFLDIGYIVDEWMQK
jgi:hypothetical protein